MKPEKITEMWAWVCDEPDGGQGVLTMTSAGQTMPMCVSRRELALMLRPLAVSIAKASGYPTRLVRFSTMTVEEELP